MPAQPPAPPGLRVRGKPLKGADIKIVIKGDGRPLTLSKDRTKLVEWTPKPTRSPQYLPEIEILDDRQGRKHLQPACCRFLTGPGRYALTCK